MNKEELIGKLQMVYVGDKNALNELICYYDGLKQGIEELQQQNQKYKEVIDKAIGILKDNFVYDYVRSCDTTDGVGYDEIDTEHFTYRVYEILKEVE